MAKDDLGAIFSCPLLKWITQIGSTEAFKLNSMGLVKYHGNEVFPLCNLYRQYFRTRLGV